MNILGLDETIRVLRKRGYTEDFNLSSPKEEFVIDEVYRFDVLSDPDDQSVLYAIQSKKTGTKGLLVNGFGIYSDSKANLIADKLLKKNRNRL